MMSHGKLQKPDQGIPPETLQQRSHTLQQAGNPPEMLPVPLRGLKTLSMRAVRACSDPGSCLYTSPWGHTGSSQDVSVIPGIGLQGGLSTSVRPAGSERPAGRPRMDNPGTTECRLSGNSHEEDDLGEIEGGGEGMRPFS
jgi:hypothetical protein